MSGHAADTAAVVIGSGTKNGRRVPVKTYHYPKPKGEVFVLMRNAVVGHKDLGTLVRFSKTAAIAFPKPSEGAVHLADEGSQMMVSVMRSNGGKAVKIDRMVADLDGISIPSTTEDGEQVLIVILDDTRFWDMPSEEAVSLVFGWMDTAKQANGDAPVDLITLPELTLANFRLGCEVYATILLLDIRPAVAVSKLIKQLQKAIAETPHTLELLTAVHEALPLDNTMMKDTIRSLFQHIENGNFDHSKIREVEAYMAKTDLKLYNCFIELRNKRPIHHAFLSGAQAQGTGQRGGRY